MSTLKKQILELRKKGYSYDRIRSELSCSKSTISYYCGENQSHKRSVRQKKRRSINVLNNKIESFLHRKANLAIASQENQRDIRKILQIKLKGFSMNRKSKKVKQKFSLQDLMDKIGNNPRCYITGRSIDLKDGKSYHLDHIIPISKGGDNSIDNCEIACKEANQAKHNLSYDEFVQLCKEVVNKSQAWESNPA
jgi:5-methylcytosine-specific restriction endonuclease McrA